MHAIVHRADVQDRDGAFGAGDLVGFHPFLLKLVADGGYRGAKFRAAQRRFEP